METVKAERMVLVLWKVASMKEIPGANMLDARGETKVIDEMRPNSNHFRESAKLSGIWGSDCESQPMRPLSRSVRGRRSFSSVPFLEREVRCVAMRERRDLVLAVVGTFSKVSIWVDW